MTTPPTTLLVLADPAEPQLKMLDRFRAGMQIVTGQHAEDFARSAPVADAILVWSASRGLVQQVWAMAPRVRWIHSRAAGLDTLLFPALVDSPVPLTNSSGVYSRSLGEFVAAAVLFFAKDFHRMKRNQAAGRWEQFDVEEAHGKTMGIVGYGDIGRASARLAKALGMRVIALRRRPEHSRGDELVDEALGSDRLLELMGRSDYVVVAAPLTPGTRGLVGAAAIAAMKPTGVLINVGRGAVVDEAALIGALHNREIRGAALDVFDQEPLPAGHPFYAMENLLLSPHCADHTPTWIDDAMHFFVRNLEHFERGEPLENVVEKTLGY
jgi:phosphoglycerate dehydrogenase-like enzyme